MAKKGYFTEFYDNINKQAKATYEYMCVNNNSKFVYGIPSVDSDEYRRQANKLLSKINQDANALISIKEYFSGKADEPWSDEMQYFNMAFNMFLSTDLGLSEEEIKAFFLSKTIPENNRAYYQKFREFFIKHKLLVMGDTLSREQVENRIRRAKVNMDKLNSSGTVMSEYIAELQRNLEAYNTALEYMQFAGIGRVDLFALFNAHSLTVYVPKGQKLNPRDKLVEVFPIDKSFVLEEDVVSRD